MKTGLIVAGYSVWGAVGFFFICSGVNPIVGALLGLVYGFLIGRLHGIDYHNATSGAILWATRGTFFGAMGTVGVAFMWYRLFPGFHDAENYIVYCVLGV